MTTSGLDLTIAAARFCGLKWAYSAIYQGIVTLNDYGNTAKQFSPLNDLNDLDVVVCRLIESGFEICIWEAETGSHFSISDDEQFNKTGAYPAEYPRSILELAAELHEGKG